MSEKRKDNKGRILKTGESQRKDGLYQYRYTDIQGKRQTVYAPDLRELREKEKEIQISEWSGVRYQSTKMTVDQLLEHYIETKRREIRSKTNYNYNCYRKMIYRSGLGLKKASEIKTADARLWMASQLDAGYQISTMHSLKVLLSSAYGLAVSETLLTLNPFSFKNKQEDESLKRTALTQRQQKELIEFLDGSTVYSYYTDMIKILIATGLRIGELLGLTVKDVDLVNRRINVDHQLTDGKIDIHKDFFIPPKTKRSIRHIPMTCQVTEAFRKIVNERMLSVEGNVQTDSILLFVNKRGDPISRNHIEQVFCRIKVAFNKEHENKLPEKFSPHVLRHTFCTNMSRRTLDIKSLQYIMGHSSIKMIMEVYDHVDFERAREVMNSLESN